jgi:hypothetical protein
VCEGSLGNIGRRDCWITDGDEDYLSEERASKVMDQQEPDLIRVQEWLIQVEE